MSLNPGSGGPPRGVDTANLGAYSQPFGPTERGAPIQVPELSPEGPNPNPDATAQPDLSSPAGRIAENEARSRRNSERQERREAGNVGVEEDEDLLEIEPEDAGGPHGTQDTMGTIRSQNPGIAGGGGEDPATEGLMGVIMARAMDLLDSALVAKKAKGAKTLGRLEEGVADPGSGMGSRRNRLDRRLITLLKLGFHLPLTLCTNEAIEVVRAQPTRLADKRYTDADGNKVLIVDVNAGWPEEREISSEDWKDAWANLLQVLPEILVPDGVKRFREHFEFLSRQQNFKVRFPAIRQFDIDVRHNYFWGRECLPFSPGSPEYVSELIQRQNDVAMEMASRPSARYAEQVSYSTQANHSMGTNFAQVARYHPYGGDRGGFAQRGRGGGRGAGLAPEAKRPMCAPSAGPRPIMPVVSGASERDRIITTYRADTIEEELRRWGLWEKHAALPGKLQFGFRIGDMRPLTKTFTPENHKGGRENIEFIIEYTTEQVKLGHMTGPYSEEQVREILGSHFRSSPLSVVPKSSLEPNKLRLIQNCSFRDEDGVSVNDMITTEDFPTEWGTAAEVAEIGAPMDAVVDILDARGWGPNKKWVDDLNNFRFPTGRNTSDDGWEYAHSVDDIFDLGERLGLPWHKDKWTAHDFTGVYLGFLWNVPERTVALPDRKRLKYRTRLVDALEAMKGGARRIDLTTMEKLSGSLAHATFVYPRGRTYLSALYMFVASYPNEHALRYPPKSVVSDLKWWLELLSLAGERRMLVARGPVKDLDLWVDASTSWGIGVVIADTWDAWRWRVTREVWNTCSRDIGWAEMLAIELLLRRMVEMDWENANLLVRSDNEGVIKAFRRGRSRNWQVNMSIRRAELICMEKNIQIIPVYVNTKDNRADPVSRGIPGPTLSRFHSKFRLPDEISEFLVHA
ncbi:hypothetical protein BN946_scf184946.g37 [Trametes cinnabarina]|uniref:Uncharacterized protein n=1 Tax=Pycnoporus cinnabarinus TaxID=5643 RepID=A0A060SYK5_PYCCI|nr:hypothetical protein BN946_scf184946.g37 [Trametes cinnabarina]